MFALVGLLALDFLTFVFLWLLSQHVSKAHLLWQDKSRVNMIGGQVVINDDIIVT